MILDRDKIAEILRVIKTNENSKFFIELQTTGLVVSFIIWDDWVLNAAHRKFAKLSENNA